MRFNYGKSEKVAQIKRNPGLKFYFYGKGYLLLGLTNFCSSTGKIVKLFKIHGRKLKLQLFRFPLRAVFQVKL